MNKVDFTEDGEKLTAGQLLFWAGQRLYPNSPLYNVVFTFGFYGKLDAVLFAEAFKELVLRCDNLRTVHQEVKGEPVQLVLNDYPSPLKVMDWSGEPDPSGKVKEWVEKNADQVIDVREVPYESVLFRLNPEQYIWYIKQHHINVDATGVAIQYEHLTKIYTKLKQGSELPAIPLYRNYRHREATSRETIVSSYWEGLDLPPPIPFAGINQKNIDPATEHVQLRIEGEDYEALRAFTKTAGFRHFTEDLSLYNILATVFFSLLNRISDQARIAIGTPAHNRTTPVLQKTPGLLMEVLPLSVEIKAGDSFRDLHKRVYKSYNDFLRNGKPGLAKPELVRNINVILNYIKAEFSSFNGISVVPRWRQGRHVDPNHHLRLQIYNFSEEAGLTLEFDMNESVFTRYEREHLPKRFLRLLRQFIGNPDLLLEDATLLSETEREESITAFNQTSQKFPDHHFLTLFSTCVQANWEKTAVIVGEKQITYAELHLRSNQMARYLKSISGNGGNIMGLHLGRSAELIIAILGCWKAGLAYLPIAVDLPEPRKKQLVEQGKVDLLLTGGDNGNTITDYTGPIIDLSVDSSIIESNSNEDLIFDPNPESIAYCLYTSGSTGVPKGVVISHYSLANYLQWAVMEYGADTPLVFPLFTSIGFDLTVTSLFTPLITGGQVVIYPEPADGQPDLSLFHVLRENRVNAIKLTPSHLSLIGDDTVRDSSVRKMIVGGEQFTAAAAEKAQRVFGPDTAIYNEYGPTEATVGCIVHRFLSDKAYGSFVPIGRPISNVKVYVLDGAHNPVIPGKQGELYIGGHGLARGYLNDQTLTDEKFLPDPFDASQKIYRTGDIVRLNERGELIFIGRVDRQIKHRGFRIELNEIEATVNTIAGVDMVSVQLLSHHEIKSVEVQHCVNCGLPSNYPNADFDETNTCLLCRNFEEYRRNAHGYFREMEDLRELIGQAAQTAPKYDCLMLLSGGKDSSYALARLVEMGFRVLAFTLDNGYISREALENVDRVTKALGVEYVVGSTPAMNEIFVDSLERHCNVCNGCFKTIYTLATQVALEKEIPFVVTGLSRGQFFETRLTEELFWSSSKQNIDIDELILEARKIYHRADDAVNRRLDVSMFDDDRTFEKVKFLDFYRYCDATLDEMMTFLGEKLPWVRPSDTGRSTNCIINQVGIHVHKKRKGYNNYAFPYSWDVRIGHKERDAALEEINELVDVERAEEIMKEIGYSIPASEGNEPELIAFYVPEKAGGMNPKVLRAELGKLLPWYMIPSRFVMVEEFPLTDNGKVDRTALVSQFSDNEKEDVNFEPPASDLEEFLADIWQLILGLERIGRHDNFLHLGGHSLTAIRLAARINESLGLEISLLEIFDHPTIAQQASYLDEIMQKSLSQ